MGRRGHVAVKTMSIHDATDTEHMMIETVIQGLLFSFYESKHGWAPVHHPFPEIYAVQGRRQEWVTYMFLFQKPTLHETRSMQILLQIASVLQYTNDQSDSIRFMHGDMHWGNLMERANSKSVSIQGIDAGKECTIIDFGFSWLQMPDGDVLVDQHTPLSQATTFNPQYDLRILLVGAYFEHCVDHQSYREIPKDQLSSYARFLLRVINTARSQSRRFHLSVDLKTIRLWTKLVRGLSTHSNVEFDAWWASVRHDNPLLPTPEHEWASLVFPFLRLTRQLWENVWNDGQWPPLGHMQYQYAVNNRSTHVFDPSNLLPLVVQQIRSNNGVIVHENSEAV